MYMYSITPIKIKEYMYPNKNTLPNYEKILSIKKPTLKIVI